MHFLIRLLPVLVAVGATHFSTVPFTARDLRYIQGRLQSAYNVTLIRRLVSGGDGAVYQATQEPDMFAVQLSFSKGYHNQESWFNLGASEWECLKMTVHPNLLMAFDHVTYSLGKTEAVRVTFIELLGPNLKQLEKLSETPTRSVNHGLPLSVVLRIAHDVSSGLKHLHSLFVAHNNIKLENIVMIDSHNPRQNMTLQLAQAQFKLIGLGLCRDYANWTDMETGHRTGDHRYASPEKLNSSLPYNAFLADAYAFGATLARALMGEQTRLAIMERIHRHPQLQLSSNPIDTVYRMYRAEWLSGSLDQQDDFYNLVGLLLEPLEANRMSVDKFVVNLNYV